MKEGWSYKKLGEVCEILNGFAFKSSNYVPEGVRVIRITNVQKGYVEDNDPKYYPYETKDELSRYLLREGDMLLSLTGNVGRVAILEKSYLPAYLNQRVACIRVRKGVDLNLSFLFHLLYSQKFEDDCIKSSKGAAQLNMSTVWLASYLIPVPPLTEQQAIVSRLDSAFAKIDAVKANAEKQLSDAKALFQKALSKAMEPKEGWEEKSIGEIANVIHGKNQKDVICENGKYPIYGSGGNIMGYASDYLCEAGTTILGRKGSINNPMYIEEKFWNVDTAFGIGPKGNNVSKFIYYFVLSIDWNEKNTGTTLPSLTQQVVKNVKLSVPPLSEQQAIVTHLDTLSEKLKAVEEKQKAVMAECDAMKQALLREVFETPPRPSQGEGES